MLVRGNSAISPSSAEYEIIRRQVLDLYIVTENASQCYQLFRRAVSGGEYKLNRANAASWFKREDNVLYMEGRRTEIARRFFEEYAKSQNLDITDFKKEKGIISDVENMTADELRTKSLNELEDIKNSTTDDKLKVDVLKQITDLMQIKRREEQTLATETYIHFHLPYKACNNCIHKDKIKKK